MTLLKFFLEFGKHGLGALWIPYALVSGWLLYQAVRASKSGWKQQKKDGTTDYGKENIPIYKTAQFIGVLILTVIAVIVHFAIQGSYK